jgi:hypothetical protein
MTPPVKNIHQICRDWRKDFLVSTLLTNGRRFEPESSRGKLEMNLEQLLELSLLSLRTPQICTWRSKEAKETFLKIE